MQHLLPPPPVQTVPSQQPLYKNSFTYHTVSASPPPFDECYAFLGAALRGEGSCQWMHRVLHAVLTLAAGS